MRLWVFENGLASKAGHHFNNSVGLRQACAERGLDVQFFIHQLAEAEVIAALDAQLVFRYTPYAKVSKDPLAGSLESALTQGTEFAKGFDVALAQGMTSDDLVFIPTTTQAELYGCAVAFRRLPPERRPRLILNFMMENFLARGTTKLGVVATLYRFAMNALQPGIVGNRLILAANGNGMAAQFSQVLGRTVSLYPMPKCYPAMMPESSGAPLAGRRCRVAVLGHSRPDKGLHLIPPLIGRHPELDFLIHVSGAQAEQLWQDAKATTDTLANLEIIRGALDASDYHALMARADVLLLPYDAKQIPFRSSGVFSEAVAAGKIVVVPKGTWMEEHLSNGNGAGACFPSRTTACISESLKLVTEKLTELDAHARSCAPRWRAEQSIAAYIDQALASFGLNTPKTQGTNKTV